MGRSLRQPPSSPKTLPFASGRLDSWKEIAAYLRRDIRTVQRWEETSRLPVYRRAQGRLKGSPVYAFRSELDAWLRQSPPQLQKEPKTVPPRWGFWAAVLVLIVGAGATVWRFGRSKPAAPPLRVVRLTSYAGVERHPAFSPDGKQIAFSWNGVKEDNFDLYVRFLDGGEPLRLTAHPGVDGWPAWSPDGRMLAFGCWVYGTPSVDLLMVPALGGAERKLGEFYLPPQSSDYWPAVCWTLDGKWLIGPYSALPRGPGALVLLSVETLEFRYLTRPAAGSVGDCCPTITQDGRRLAFLRAAQGRVFNLYEMALGPDYQPIGDPRQLTNEASGVANPMWTSDGRQVLYTASTSSS